MKLNNHSFLIAGQLKTGLLEPLEIYLKSSTSALGVIGTTSPFLTVNLSRCTLYEANSKQKTQKLSAFLIHKVTKNNRPLMIISYLAFVFNYLKAVFFLNRRFDVFIGISSFSALLGIFLKKVGMVDVVIYYCLDFYPNPKTRDFMGFVNYLFRHVERYLIKNSDFVWDLSPKISIARESQLNIPQSSYKKIVVPVGYSQAITRIVPLEKRERWTIGFIGSVSPNQGLELVVNAMPELLVKFPELKVKIIGHGTDVYRLRKMISDKMLDKHFIFHGFIANENEAYEILSHCVIGLATYTGDITDNSSYSEPGKPKLYMLLGLPIVITSKTSIATDITKYHAGISIDYTERQFIEAVTHLIETDEEVNTYYSGVRAYQPQCASERIYERAFEQTNISHS